MRLTSANDLKPIVLAFASWERVWTNWLPTNNSAGKVQKSSSSQGDSKLQEQVDRLRVRAAEMQSQRDKAEARASRGSDALAPPRGGKPGGGRGKGGKGGGKDERGGKQFDHKRKADDRNNRGDDRGGNRDDRRDDRRPALKRR